MSRIAAIATALPAYSYPQREITDMFAPMVARDPKRQALMRRMHSASGVDTRHLVLPLDEYGDAETFGQTNDRFIGEATRLAAESLTRALDSAQIAPNEVDFIIFTSVTGISAPSVDALLVPVMGLRDDVKRVPIFGLGCVAGAAGIARLHDYLVGHPDEVGVLLSVELCSLTVQRDDDSMDNMVASGLFGDGAAAVVMVGERRALRLPHPAPRVTATRSRLYPGSHDIIGFRPSETGFRVILTAGVVDVIDANFPGDVRTFLADNDLAVGDIDAWVAHPGGPRVLDAFERGIDLPPRALERSRRSMAAVGNLSSSSVLHVLAAEADAAHAAGDHALLFALGPGMSAEFVLLEWDEAVAAVDRAVVTPAVASVAA